MPMCAVLIFNIPKRYLCSSALLGEGIPWCSDSFCLDKGRAEQRVALHERMFALLMMQSGEASAPVF